MLSESTRRMDYTGNGATTVYSFTFRVDDQTELKVVKRDTSTPPIETTLTLTTDYTVSGVGVDAGGSITLTTALPPGYTLTIFGEPIRKQNTDFQNQGSFYPKDHEKTFDRLTAMIQRLAERMTRTIRQPETEQGGDFHFPFAAQRANQFLAFDSNGAPIASPGSVPSVAVSTFMATVLDDVTAAAALTTLGVSAFIQTLLDDADSTTARTTLGVNLTNLGVSSFIQTLVSAADAQTARATLQAEPLRNRIINGNFDFWQRGTTFNAAANSTWTADRFQVKYVNNAGVPNVVQDTDVPTVAQSGYQSRYSLKYTCGVADASPASGAAYYMRYAIEGQDYQPLYNQQVTLSFWVKSAVTGTYSIRFFDVAGGMYYIATYTVNQASTWEQKSVTLTLNASGSHNFDNTAGLEIDFVMATGSGGQTASIGVWASSSTIFSSTSQVNFMASNVSRFFWLSQLQLNVGSSSPRFSRAGGTVVQELSLCQRYYEKSYNLADAPGTNTSTGRNRAAGRAVSSTSVDYVGEPFKIPKRATPSVLFWTPDGVSGSLWYDGSPYTTSQTNTSEYQIGWFTSAASGLTVNTAVSVLGHWTADAEL